MDWVSPQYSRKKVDAAGELLATLEPEPDGLDEALAIVGNWRSAHSRPLYTFRYGLRLYAEKVDPNVLVAQRIKRLSSVVLKLALQPNMKLSQMQDIGGCRAVLGSVAHVHKLLARYRQSDIKHKLITTNDYIESPKSSGYRSIHLVYKYFSDRKASHNGLRIEVQIRSQRQHAWATAVETVGTFTRQALKSSQGQKDWLRFFALMGTAIAETENSAPVPGTPTNANEMRTELKDAAQHLDVVAKLRAFGASLNAIQTPSKNADYYLLQLDPVEMKIDIKSYLQKELSTAFKEYSNAEREIAGTSSDAVLVSVDSVASLRRAYPNYFLDTHAFVEMVSHAIL